MPFTNVLKVYQRSVFNVSVITFRSIWLELGWNNLKTMHNQATATGVTAAARFLRLGVVAFGAGEIVAVTGLAVTKTGAT